MKLDVALWPLIKPVDRILMGAWNRLPAEFAAFLAGRHYTGILVGMSMGIVASIVVVALTATAAALEPGPVVEFLIPFALVYGAVLTFSFSFAGDINFRQHTELFAAMSGTFFDGMAIFTMLRAL